MPETSPDPASASSVDTVPASTPPAAVTDELAEHAVTASDADTSDPTPAGSPAASGTAATATPPGDYKLVLRILTVATFVVILNETIMVNAIPQLMTSLHITAHAAQWLSTAFMLTMAVVIPTTGWLLQRFDRRTVFAAAMGSFALGTLLAAVAPNFGVILVGRIVQATGTAIMMPLLMTTVMTIVPLAERGKTMGNVSLAISVAPALGPTTSGLILQFASWRWLFLLVLPLALACGLIGFRLMPKSGSQPAGKLDVVSIPFAAAGFGGLIYGMSQLGGHTPGAEPVVEPWIAIVVGAASVAVLVWRQLRLARTGGAPLMDLRALASPGFGIAVGVMCIAMLAMMGTMILLPLWLQSARGLSVLEAGLVMMPGGLMMGLLGPRIGKLYDKVGPRPLVTPGAAIVVLATALGAWAAPHAAWWVYLLIHPLLSFGLALMFTPLFTAGLGSLPGHLYSHGSSILGTFQQVAAGAGTALAVTVMTWRAEGLAKAGEKPLDALSGGVSTAMWVAAATCCIALALTFFVKKPENATPGH